MSLLPRPFGPRLSSSFCRPSQSEFVARYFPRFLDLVELALQFNDGKSCLLFELFAALSLVPLFVKWARDTPDFTRLMTLLLRSAIRVCKGVKGLPPALLKPENWHWVSSVSFVPFDTHRRPFFQPDTGTPPPAVACMSHTIGLSSQACLLALFVRHLLSRSLDLPDGPTQELLRLLQPVVRGCLAAYEMQPGAVEHAMHAFPHPSSPVESAMHIQPFHRMFILEEILRARTMAERENYCSAYSQFQLQKCKLQCCSSPLCSATAQFGACVTGRSPHFCSRVSVLVTLVMSSGSLAHGRSVQCSAPYCGPGAPVVAFMRRVELLTPLHTAAHQKLDWKAHKVDCIASVW